MIKFSVLIAVYKKDNPFHFSEALESIFDKQQLKPDQIVIIKDGLLTSELDVVLNNFKRDKKIVDVKSLKKNIGLGGALAIGVENCKYEYIARMDADDIAKGDRFLKQINFLMKNPEIDVLGSWVDEFVGTKENIVSVRKVPKNHKGCINMLKYGAPFNHPSVIFRKATIFKAGNYKPFFLKEDVYLWLRLHVIGAYFANLPESLLFFRTSKAMFGRRSGLKYAKSEWKLTHFRYENKIISIFELLFYNVPNILIRLLPSFLIRYIYILQRFLK